MRSYKTRSYKKRNAARPFSSCSRAAALRPLRARPANPCARFFPVRQEASWPRAGWRTGWESGASSVSTWAEPRPTSACSTARPAPPTRQRWGACPSPCLSWKCTRSAQAAAHWRRLDAGGALRVGPEKLRRRARTDLLRTGRHAARRDRRPPAAGTGWTRSIFSAESFHSTCRQTQKGFEKFLLGRDGTGKGRRASRDDPAGACPRHCGRFQRHHGKSVAGNLHRARA